MESLIDALTLYAAENLISRFQQETAVQTRAAWREVDRLTNQLETVSPEAKKWMEALKEELLKMMEESRGGTSPYVEEFNSLMRELIGTLIAQACEMAALVL